MGRDMTTGNIARVLIVFSLPMIASAILQQLYNLADALIVGNFVGEVELAAVGSTSAVSQFAVNVIIGITRGVSILVAQSYGAGKYREIGNISSTFTVVLTGVSVVLTGVCIALTDILLMAINTPADIFPHAATYLKITFLGLPFLVLYNLYGGMLRGVGNSRAAFISIIISSVANVGLNLFFVLRYGMGVEGVAYATVIAQGFMAIYLILVARHSYPILSFRFSGKLIHREELRSGVRMGLPMAVQASIMSFGRMLLQNIMNSFGTTVVTGVTTAYRIDSLCMVPVVNISAAVSTFTGQNIGGRRPDRVKEGFKKGLAIVLFTSVAMTSLVVIFGSRLLGFFGISDGAIYYGQQFLIMCSVFYPAYALENILAGFLQGCGDVVSPAVATVSALGLRLALSYALAGVVGFRIVAYAEAASWVANAVMCFVRYRVVLKKVISDEVKPVA